MSPLPHNILSQQPFYHLYISSSSITNIIMPSSQRQTVNAHCHAAKHARAESLVIYNVEHSLGARGQLTGGYMLITLCFFNQFVHTFPRGDMLITF